MQEPEVTRVMLRRTAAVIDGVVRGRRFEYSEDLGPRSVFSVEVVSVLAGELSDAEIELPVFGGPTRQGGAISTSVDPRLEIGTRYVLFLRNHEWYFTPVAATPLRVESALDKEFLVDRNGYPLVGLSPEGLHFRDDSLFLPLGKTRERKLDTARTPAVLAGVVDLATFTDLLTDAIAAENVAPSGVVQRKPRALGPDWRFIPTPRPTDLGPALSTPDTNQTPNANQDATGSTAEPR